MKKYILLICIGLLGASYSEAASNCENKLLVKLLQDLIDNSNLILPRTTDIQEVVNNLSDCCASSSDAVGELTDIGSCLDSQIDVPDDINNLTITVIALLKTILLDLRGCNIP